MQARNVHNLCVLIGYVPLLCTWKCRYRRNLVVGIFHNWVIRKTNKYCFFICQTWFYSSKTYFIWIILMKWFHRLNVGPSNRKSIVILKWFTLNSCKYTTFEWSNGLLFIGFVALVDWVGYCGKGLFFVKKSHAPLAVMRTPRCWSARVDGSLQSVWHSELRYYVSFLSLAFRIFLFSNIAKVQ